MGFIVLRTGKYGTKYTKGGGVKARVNEEPWPKKPMTGLGHWGPKGKYSTEKGKKEKKKKEKAQMTGV